MGPPNKDNTSFSKVVSGQILSLDHRYSSWEFQLFDNFKCGRHKALNHLTKNWSICHTQGTRETSFSWCAEVAFGHLNYVMLCYVSVIVYLFSS